MADDIIARLRANADGASTKDGGHIWLSLSPRTSAEAADLIEAQQAEIERLRVALALACGELSTTDHHRNQHPEALMQQFLDEARRA